jgi:hypothetical protein
VTTYNIVEVHVPVEAHHVQRAVEVLRSLDRVPTRRTVADVLRAWARIGLENQLYTEDYAAAEAAEMRSAT